jgi:predicted TIM-barrel fold metal-dependent hydrolase
VADPRADAPAKPAVIDCDVHQELKSVHDLVGYIDDKWRHYIANRGFKGPPGLPYAVWLGPDRADTTQPDGTRASAHFDVLRRDHLDRWNIEYAILTGPASMLGVCAMPQFEFASALAAAHNDLVADVWLGRDPRIKGSISVAAQDPIAAAREIDRMAAHPDMVQVILPMLSPGPQWADEKYHPIWEAAERNGIPVGFHLLGSSGMMNPPTSAGWPRSFMELSCSFPLTAQAELIGLVCRGTFERFPGLRLALIELGFSWLPPLLWRLDMRWSELRAEVPWLRRKPSEYVRDHVRLTTQPLDQPGDNAALLQAIEWVGPELLMFSSDYPHWDFDSPERALPAATERGVKQAILAETARAFYGLA